MQILHWLHVIQFKDAFHSHFLPLIYLPLYERCWFLIVLSRDYDMQPDLRFFGVRYNTIQVGHENIIILLLEVFLGRLFPSQSFFKQEEK